MPRVLFVDDQQRELDGMARMLDWGGMGIEIAAAVTDARQALKIVASEPVDIVITDVIMQNMDGLTLVRELKNSNPHIKTICISGFDDFKFVSMAINNGASGYVLKPILVNEFVQVLERVLADIQKERASFAGSGAINPARVALIIADAQDPCEGLSEAERALNIRVARGACIKPENALAVLNIRGGERVALLDACAKIPEGADVSGAYPLERAREGYLELLESARGASNEADCVEIIKRNIENNPGADADTLLKNVYLSAGYANALFKSATGMTIHRYVVKRRLERAAELLLSEPDALVKDIAWRLGFADASHLINSFQKSYGVTPERYRRKRAKP